jgi:hypothetical protein
MFRALFAHPQEAHHKRHLVYCVCVMSEAEAEASILVQPADITNIPSAVCVAPPEDEQAMLETCRGP